MPVLFTTVDWVPSMLFAEIMHSTNTGWMTEHGPLTSMVTLGNLLNLPEPRHISLHGRKFLWKLNKITFVSMSDTKHLLSDVGY